MISRKRYIICCLCSVLGYSPFLIHTQMTYAQDKKPVSTLEIRALQSREFQNIDMNQAYYAALSTFQDLGFIITETSQSLGLIEANQMHPDENKAILATLTLSNDSVGHVTARLSLSTYPVFSGEEGMNLGGAAPRHSELIKTPATYQQFFDAFSYAIHLKKQ